MTVFDWGGISGGFESRGLPGVSGSFLESTPALTIIQDISLVALLVSNGCSPVSGRVGSTKYLNPT
jgi:hypothetical protein